MKYLRDQIKSVTLTSFIVMCVLLSATAATAQDWRGLEPIKSTCEDVERQLGGAACGKQTIGYTLPDATVRFVFSGAPCHEKWPYEQYRVPPGTVTWILATPRHPTKLFISDLNVDKSKLQKGDPEDMLDVVVYLSSEMGIKFTASEDEGRVLDITYTPASKYDHLRCSPPTTAQPANESVIHGLSPILIGKYHPPSREQEKLICSKIVTGLHEASKRIPEAEARKATIYIMAYAGRRTHAGEAQKWAEHAKSYLMRQYKIEPNRIMAVDGGYREKAEVQLFIRPFGAPAPSIEPTIHPSQVVIARKQEGKATKT